MTHPFATAPLACEPRCNSVKACRVYNVVPIKAEVFKPECAICDLRALCVPAGRVHPDLKPLASLVSRRQSVPRGKILFRAGDPFNSLYAVRTGFFKTYISSEDGRDQVTGFQMAGELLGLDGISTDRHACGSVALEDSQVCVIPYARLASLAHDFGELQHQFHKLMSREIVRDQGVMLLLSRTRAEQRVATFLLNLMQRLEARGFSASSLVLRMSREEIGSYLGLKLETVSRTFSKFQEDGILDVKQRHIHVLDGKGLKNVGNGSGTWG